MRIVARCLVMIRRLLLSYSRAAAIRRSKNAFFRFLKTSAAWRLAARHIKIAFAFPRSARYTCARNAFLFICHALAMEMLERCSFRLHLEVWRCLSGALSTNAGEPLQGCCGGSIWVDQEAQMNSHQLFFNVSPKYGPRTMKNSILRVSGQQVRMIYYRWAPYIDDRSRHAWHRGAYRWAAALSALHHRLHRSRL